MKRFFNSGVRWLHVAVLIAATLLPFTTANVSAAQLTSRKVTIDKSAAGSTNITHIFAFTIPTTAAVQGITYEFCTTPLGTCTLPTGMSVQAATQQSQTGFPTNATSFTAHAVSNEGGCTMGTNTYMMCFERTIGTTGNGAVTHTIAGITAPSSKQTVYVRITLYSNDTFATATDSGTVAEAFVDQLVTSGRVQERLEFCVASLDSAAALPANVTACAALASNSVDIGVIDSSSIAISPVATTSTNGSNNKYGIVMSNTNGSGGIVVSYFPEQAATGTNQLRSFRVAGSTCNVSNANVTDTCFVDAGATKATFAAGTEKFGLYVACIDNTQGTTTSNTWTVTDDYNGNDNTVTSVASCQTEASNTEFAWNTGGTAVTLASVGNVVDDEIIKVRYAAAAAATTPTGAYTASTNYIATATF